MKRTQLFSTSLIFSVILLFGISSYASERIKFTRQWRFYLGDTIGAYDPTFDDTRWRVLNLPHDWSIEGEFSDKHPATPGGGALPGGVGWYRKTFTIDPKDKDFLFFIDFDGVYRNAEVWINGHYLGKRPYGYASFRYELTPYLYYGTTKNVIAVRVDNSQQPNSRWYSGSGIYRNVWLVKSAKLHIGHWGIYVTTPEVSLAKATVSVQTEVKNATEQAQKFELRQILLDAEGKMVAQTSEKLVLVPDSTAVAQQLLSLGAPKLWSLDNPYLYRLKTEIRQGNRVIDMLLTPVGVRYFTFDTNEGFFLNGKAIKINGVCNHHDLGCLGAAINRRALERQLEILKAMGTNAIRTSHNPPAPELLELCDSMGFLVMDEAFDMWRKKKTDYDYALDFDEWHKRDLADLVRRDRNHPSVIIWSIGNEILEQWDSTGTLLARHLAEIVRKYDTTRPITAACNDPRPHNFIIKSGALDLIGYNYHHQEFTDFHKNFPGAKFIATETVSALATRDAYDMPSDSIRRWPIRWDIPFTTGNPDYTCSSYDNCSAPWGSTHEETWLIIKKYPYLSGQFIWTGFDYLGEPTPYSWPARSSYFGIIDLAGFPKNTYYLYQSEWTNQPVLHVFPHWNWKIGDTIDVWVYTNQAEVELFLNGKSLGKKAKSTDDLHLSWRVIYEPGQLMAVGYVQGKESLRKVVNTAGKPAKILLEPDRSRIKADGEDLSFVKVTVVDSAGNRVPYADNLIQFEVEGYGFIAGVDNGNQISHEPFKANYRKAFHGLCLVVLQSDGKKGTIRLLAKSQGLESNTITIQAK
ncbi:MAG: beta-galactosidase GalB [Bacteroidales bacterium]